MKRWIVFFAGFVVLAVGCGGNEKTSEAQRPLIGVSLLTTTNPFFYEMGEAIRAEAEKNGYDVLITAGDLDIGKQKNQVSDFIVKDVAAIVLTPIDSRSIGASIAEANQAGIPVFTADIATTAEGVEVISHVATDNYQAGKMAAQALIEATGGEGKVGIIDHPEVESVIMRTKGFMDELEKQRTENNVALEVVSRLPGSGTRDRSFKAVEDMLQAHPDLAGIFAINDPSALGAVAAIEKAGRNGRVQVISIDGMPEGRQAVKDGKIFADVLQRPDQIGQKTVQVIIDYMNGREVSEQILIPTSIYRQADAQNDSDLSQSSAASQ